VQPLQHHHKPSGNHRAANRYVGNLPPMPGVFPDFPAPVVRNAGAERELTMMRWGMPPPPKFGGPPVTNIRNTSSPHWRGWLKPEIKGHGFQFRGGPDGSRCDPLPRLAVSHRAERSKPDQQHRPGEDICRESSRQKGRLC
jgi:hypothetical protein